MKIAETSIHADHFIEDASAILISHYHRDHLRGIRRSRNYPPIVCSPLTATLLSKIERLKADALCPLDVGESVELSDAGQPVHISALEANHCPGAVMFLVEWGGKRALYTGDFRMNDAVREGVVALPELDYLYLDGTYDDPRYDFPSEEEAVEQVLALLRKRDGRKAFVAIYSIGKNCILQAAFEEFGLPFYMPEDKRHIYEAIGMGHLVTGDRDATPFRAYARGYLEHHFRMTRHFHNALIIIPTGWEVGRPSSDRYCYVPYSEHCDFKQLQEFCTLVRAKETIKTHG